MDRSLQALDTIALFPYRCRRAFCSDLFGASKQFKLLRLQFWSRSYCLQQRRYISLDRYHHTRSNSFHTSILVVWFFFVLSSNGFFDRFDFCFAIDWHILRFIFRSIDWHKIHLSRVIHMLYEYGRQHIKTLNVIKQNLCTL